MADLLSHGVSGLLAFQRALDTTSHNIANVTTDGYSRQRVDSARVRRKPSGGGWIGRASNVRPCAASTTTSSPRRPARPPAASSTSTPTLRKPSALNNLFGDSANGLTASLQRFVDAIQSVANTPASIPARQVLLERGAMRWPSA